MILLIKNFTQCYKNKLKSMVQKHYIANIITSKEQI